jgi:hypothetical protein
MSPQELSEHLRLKNPLVACPEDNPARVALSDQSGQYVLDEAGNIIGLNLFGMADDDGKATFPCPTEWLGELPKLRYLNLARCGLSACDLSELPDLVVVFLQHNPALSQLNLPEEFRALVRADLSHCGLTAVHWPASPQLDFLNVSRQTDGALVDFKFVGACPALYLLDLSHNGLREFSLPEDFGQLGLLWLENNALEQVSFTGGLPALESLRLNNNRLREIPEEWRAGLSGVQNLFLEGNELLSDDYRTALSNPAENPKIVQEILTAHIESGVGRDDECKVLIVGNGRVGKTTMYRKLNGLELLENQSSTHGVVIEQHPWPPPPKPKKFNVQFWDFGGQDIYHATHRLFMQSSAVYIIAWNPESEKKPQSEVPEDGPLGIYQNFKLPYWYDYVYRSSGGNPRYRYDRENPKADVPVLIVQTEKERLGDEGLPPMSNPGRYFTNVVDKRVIESIPSDDFSEVDGYTSLKIKLNKALDLAKNEATAAKSWLVLRDRLREQQETGKKFLTVAEYLNLAHSVEEEVGTLGRDPMDIVKQWLHNTGVVFFQETATGERIILDQRWASKAIYSILQRQPAEKNYFEEIQQKGGYFTGQDLLRYWDDHLTEPDDVSLFEEFMLKCELAYRVREDKESEGVEFEERWYCAPQLLPEEPKRPQDRNRLLKSIEKHPDEWWHLRFFNEYLHAGIVRRLIIRLHDPTEREWVWRRGLMLADEEDNRMLVNRDASGHTINVYVEKGSPELLQKLGKELHELSSLDKPDLITVSADGLIWVDTEVLLNKQAESEILTEEGQKIARKIFDPLITNVFDRKGIGFDRIGEAAVGSENSSGTADEKNSPSAQLDSTVTDDVSSSEHKGPLQLAVLSSLHPEHPSLGVGKEIEGIQDSLMKRGSHIYEDFSANGEYTLDRNRMQLYLKRAPDLVHFIGHGDVDKFHQFSNTSGLNTEPHAFCGIFLTDHNGKEDFVTEAAMVSYLKNIQLQLKEKKRSIKLVVLSACHTAEIARRISELGIIAIGAVGKLNDEASHRFSGTLYYHLDQAGLEGLETAFELAWQEARDKNRECSQYRLYINGELRNP